jgi:NAD(P)H-hydrate epimerase
VFEPLYTADEMRAAEAGHDVEELMRQAGNAVAEEVLLRHPAAYDIVVVAGGGANGGDGRIAAELLESYGRGVRVLDAKAPGAAGEVGTPEVVIDAIFGTGFRGEPRPEAAALIEAINDSGAPVLSVDIPSGVDASTGEVAGEAVRAEATVTFHGRKVGLAVAPGRFHAGEISVAPIGLAQSATRHRLATGALTGLVPRKRAEDTKYTAGSVLVVGGSRGLAGAACLAAEAAFRADAGYVAVAAPESSLAVLEQRLLEAVKRPLPEEDGIVSAGAVEPVLEAAQRARAVALGPGLGRGDGPRELVRRLLRELELPVVLDADALDGLEPFDRSAPTVLTPHSGELGRLLGEEAAWVDAHRLAAVERAVERFGCVVLLKGAGTLVGGPGQGAIVVDAGTPALATAGTGDVLTGVIASFLAKGVEPPLAAAAAALVHARAAERAADGRPGLIASDVIAALPKALA